MLVINALWTAATYAIPFFGVLTVVVFVHEMGHFLVGRWCGVKVDAFSLGMGPEIFGFNDRHGTRWRFALYPIGGYVKFHGDANGASAPDVEGMAQMSPAERALTLPGQPVQSRAAIIAAGPAANFLLTICIFSALFYVNGEVVHTPRIDFVEPGSAAAAAGFQPGDVVKRIDGRAVQGFEDISKAIMTSADTPMTFVVGRNGADLTIEATPRVHIEQSNIGTLRTGRLGIGASKDAVDRQVVRYGALQSIGRGVTETWFWVENTGTSLKRLVTGRASRDELSGPLRIAQVSGEFVKESIELVIRLIAILSVSIGLLNLVPIPLLDGGHLMFYAYEALRGRPLSDRAQEIGFRFGLATVAALMLFAVSNDLFNMIHDLKIFPAG